MSLIQTPEERRSELKRKLEAARQNPNAETYRIPWRQQMLALPLIQVETAWLRLNLSNGRTHAAQTSTDDSSVFKDPMSERAQIAQAKLIKELDQGRPHKRLQDDLRAHKQKEPGICTSEGYLINGNRRCVALRELGDKYMQVVVLPADATPQELYQLELELQIKPDLKVQYAEIDEILHVVRFGMERYKLSAEEIADSLGGQRSVEDVQQMQSILNLVDDYLNTIEQPGRYSLIYNKYVAFKELNERLSGSNWDANDIRLQQMKLTAFIGIKANVSANRLRKQRISLRAGTSRANDGATPFLDAVKRKLAPTLESREADSIAPLQESGTLDSALLELLDSPDILPTKISDAERSLVAFLKESLPKRGDDPATKLLNETVERALETASEVERDSRSAEKPQLLAQAALDKLRSINILRGQGSKSGVSADELLRTIREIRELLDVLESSVMPTAKAKNSDAKN